MLGSRNFDIQSQFVFDAIRRTMLKFLIVVLTFVNTFAEGRRKALVVFWDKGFQVGRLNTNQRKTITPRHYSHNYMATSITPKRLMICGPHPLCEIMKGHRCTITGTHPVWILQGAAWAGAPKWQERWPWLGVHSSDI